MRCAWLNHIRYVFFLLFIPNVIENYFISSFVKHLNSEFENCYIIQLWSFWMVLMWWIEVHGHSGRWIFHHMKRAEKKPLNILQQNETKIYYLSHGFLCVIFEHCILTFVFSFFRRLFSMLASVYMSRKSKSIINLFSFEKSNAGWYKDMWTFMMSKFGEPWRFYCLNPADIERHELSFVSPIKWNISIEWIQTKK